MPIPKQVQVGPFTYSVTVDQAAIDRAGQEGRETLYGQTRHTISRILVDPELSADQKRETLQHEVLHACINTSGLAISTTDQENLVGALSPILLDTLRRNPELVEYLLEA